MTRQWWLGVVLVFTLTSVLLARDGIVKTKDGRTISGDVDENATPDGVSVTIYGVKTVIPKSSIDSIQYTGDFSEQYQDRMSKLAPDDAAGRVEIAKWAFDNKQYDLSRQAALEAQKIDPNNRDAASLLATVQTTLAFQARHANDVPPAAPATTPADDSGTDTTSSAPAPKRFLSADQINRIRQVELKSNDNNVRISFANNVIQRYLSTGNRDVQTFNSESQAQQALEILQNAPDLGKDIKILNDPIALLEYRTQVQPRVLAGCAASGCHGGPNGGSFYLYRDAEKTEVWYTNFYILQTYTKTVQSGGAAVFGGGPVALRTVDRTQPEQSLLIQYALPAQAAVNPHPQARGWKPLFMSDQDPNYQKIIRWMGTTLKPFEEDYGIKFDLPTGASTTQPAPAPAPQ